MPLDDIIAQQTGYDAQRQQAARQRERDYYRGLRPESPPVNQALGGVVSFEKTDLMFVFMAVQTAILVLMWLNVRQ